MTSSAPKHAASEPASPVNPNYTVRSGDKLGRLSLRHGETLQQLYRSNEVVIGNDPI